MSLTAIEQQEKYALLGVVMAGRTNNEATAIRIKAEIKEQSAQIKALYVELGISNRRQRKVMEKKSRKVRSDKGSSRKDTKPLDK